MKSPSKTKGVRKAWIVLENGRVAHRDVDYGFNDFPREPIIYFTKRRAQDENSEDYDRKHKRYIYPKGVKIIPCIISYKLN